MSVRSGARTSSRHGHALEREEPLQRGLPREALDEGAQLAEPRGSLGGRVANDRGDLARERRRERRDRATRAARHPVRDERLGADEDVEARQEVLLERLERRVRDLETDDVRRVVAKTLEHGRRDRVSGRRRELVDVERHRRARRRGGEEVAVLRLLVELEVRRADDDDGVGADLGRVRGERHGVRGRLSAAVNGDLQPLVGRLQEEIGHLATLLDAQEDPFARRSEREEAVEARLDEEVGERAERVVVDCAAVLAERRDRGGERAAQGVTARFLATRSPCAIRRARVSGRFASSTQSTYSR